MMTTLAIAAFLSSADSAVGCPLPSAEKWSWHPTTRSAWIRAAWCLRGEAVIGSGALPGVTAWPALPATTGNETILMLKHGSQTMTMCPQPPELSRVARTLSSPRRRKRHTFVVDNWTL